MSKIPFKVKYLIVISTLSLISCASTSSKVITKQAPWSGPVFITKNQLPSDSISYQIVGTVMVKARSGYGSVTTLYPQLADEARRIGANAVMGTVGGRGPSGFSWAAPNVNGTAIRIENLDLMKGVDGSYH